MTEPFLSSVRCNCMMCQENVMIFKRVVRGKSGLKFKFVNGFFKSECSGTS